MLKQDQYQPLPFSKQILILFAGTGGYLDDLPVEQVLEFESELYKYVETLNPGLLKGIEEKKTLDDQLKSEMVKVITELKDKFVNDRQMAATVK